MTDINTLIAEMRAIRAAMPTHVSEMWLYSAVRHYDKHVDWDDPDDGHPLGRQSGDAAAKVLNALPALLDEIERLRGERDYYRALAVPPSPYTTKPKIAERGDR